MEVKVKCDLCNQEEIWKNPEEANTLGFFLNLKICRKCGEERAVCSKCKKIEKIEGKYTRSGLDAVTECCGALVIRSIKGTAY